MAKKQVTVEAIDASISRWQSRLRRAVNAIERLQKQRKRVVKAAARPAKVPPVAAIAPATPASPPDLAVAHPLDTAIPAFLQRKKLEPAAAAIVAEQAETKRLKARGRIAKMKAKSSGETKRMPLTGRAALEAIRNA
jgi:hypothetical protein